MISGRTRVAGVIGDPVRHSLSPALHNAAYRELGLDWVYVAFEVAPAQAEAAIRAVVTLDLVGLSVTMPHKTVAAQVCDELSDDAAVLRSVNTVTPSSNGRLRGDSTDGEGFVRSLLDAGVDPACDALILGAGGAARAVVLSLKRHGAKVTVAARKPEAAAAAAQPAGGATCAWRDRDDAARTAALIVNATPIGMASDDMPLAREVLRRGSVVADLVYSPLDTPLLGAARTSGATAVDGLGMLVHQAALQVELWSGQTAPVVTMREAARAVLVARK